MVTFARRIDALGGSFDNGGEYLAGYSDGHSEALSNAIEIGHQADKLFAEVKRSLGECLEAMVIADSDLPPHEYAAIVEDAFNRGTATYQKLIETGQTDPQDRQCPHAGPFAYCDGCKATPCPVGLS